jgi:hypothetical protein
VSDYQRAKKTVLEYLAQRTVVRDQLLRYAGLGIRAQCVEQSRTIGFSYEKVDEDVSTPRVSDPTGEQSWRPDGMLALLGELDRAETKLAGAMDRLIGHPLVARPDQLAQVLRAYRDGDDATNRLVRDGARVMQRAMSHTIDVNTDPIPGLSVDGAPGCDSCARVKENGRPWWNEPTDQIAQPTTLGDALSKPTRLCRACYRWAISFDPNRLPTLNEVQHRHDDPAGKWPRRYVTPGSRAS